MANRLVLDSPNPQIAGQQATNMFSTNQNPTPQTSYALAPGATGGYGTGTNVPINGPGLAPAQQPAGGGVASGGGGGGGIAQAATQAAARPSLDDYIKNNFLYTSTDAANQRQLDNFDATTLKGQQDVQATQALRQSNLQQSLADQGQSNAESLAGRGLLRSGINFSNQDKINQGGEQQQNGIAQLLTDYVGNRGSARLGQQDANQAALNAQIAAITQQFNAQNAGQIA